MEKVCREVDAIYFRNYLFSPVFVLERKSGKYLCILFHFLLIGKLFLKTLVRGPFCLLFWPFPLLKPNLSIFHLLNKIFLLYLLKTGVAEHSCVRALGLGDGSSLSLSPLFCYTPYTPRLLKGVRNKNTLFCVPKKLWKYMRI